MIQTLEYTLIRLGTLFYHHRLNLNLHVIVYFSCTIIVKPCYFLYYPLYSCTIIVLTLCTVMMSSLVICPYINRLFGFVFCILLKKTFGSKRSVFINNNFIIVIDNLKNSTVLLRLNKITLLYITTW